MGIWKYLIIINVFFFLQTSMGQSLDDTLLDTETFNKTIKNTTKEMENSLAISYYNLSVRNFQIKDFKNCTINSTQAIKLKGSTRFPVGNYLWG